jgi:hypothetical protein
VFTDVQPTIPQPAPVMVAGVPDPEMIKRSLAMAGANRG